MATTTIAGYTRPDYSEYPPTPVTWAFTLVDTVCEPVGCREWRQALPSSWTEPGEWLSDEYRVDSVRSFVPLLLSYQDFVKQQQEQQQLQQKQGRGGRFAARGAEENVSTSAPLSPYSLSLLKQYAFETPSTSLSDLTTPTSILVLIVLVWFIRRLKSVLMPMFSRFGRKAGRATHGKDWEQKNEVRIVKFGEYVFRLVFHSAISLAGLYLLLKKEWWTDTKQLWLNYPSQPVDPGMSWYYLVQGAYNLEAMASLLQLSFTVSFFPKAVSGERSRFPIHIGWSKDVRGDFREMFMHHVITNFLVIGSSAFRLSRPGSMVFLVHDISDVPVDLSKLANFLKWKRSTAACFASMVIVWCMTRLGVFPFVIYRSALNEAWLCCASGIVGPMVYVCYYPIFATGVGLLITLHLAWFTMFIRMGYVLVFKGEAHDLSEHKKGEEHADPTKDRTKKTN